MKRQRIILLFVLALSCMSFSACAPKSTVIQIATDATWEPFEYIDPVTQQIVGFDIDLMTAIADAAGLKIEFVDVRWTPLLDGMAQCVYPAAISSMTVTEERKELYLFSDPYIAAGQVVVVNVDNTEIAGIEDLGGRIVGVQAATTGEDELRKIADTDIRSYEGIDVAFQDLLSGTLEAVVVDSPLALTFVGQNADELKIVGEAFTDEVYGIAICKNNPELQEQINRGLATVKAAGLIEELIQKWMFNK
jgi:polar amino acid transport system substrate-binding protein